MTRSRLALATLLLVLACPPAPAQAPKENARLPLSHLESARLIPNLCLVKYRITTTSSECQAFFDQGLGYYYSYVWMESCRSFETAACYDPGCAMAWWGLSRALERRHDQGNATTALKKAQELMAGASHREQLLIRARLQEKGLWPGVGPQPSWIPAATATIDELLALYDDDEEGWYYRAQLAGGSGLFGGKLSSVPFYKALVRVNPLHPGANHELLHFYEGFQRPALGWLHAEKYIESSPGIPHPFHMQAHLATRLGRWDKTTDRSAHAVELERAYHQQMHVAPQQDEQFSHHLQILMVSLTHDGRFEEARKLKQECAAWGIQHREAWFHLHLAERNWDEALKVAEGFRRGNKVHASYLRALVYMKKGEAMRAAPEVDVLQQAYQGRRKDRKLELDLWEVQGLLLCAQGQAEAGLKLLARLVEQTKNDYSHHAWGNGASYMEEWGTAALHAGKLDVAEEAFLEALAHDRGSVRGALGLQVLCERQGRAQEATRYAELAQRCWRRAAPECLQAELLALRGMERTTGAQR
jgi:tetratricopeptide (TPR) repeat protein